MSAIGAVVETTIKISILATTFRAYQNVTHKLSIFKFVTKIIQIFGCAKVKWQLCPIDFEIHIILYTLVA